MLVVKLETQCFMFEERIAHLQTEWKEAGDGPARARLDAVSSRGEEPLIMSLYNVAFHIMFKNDTVCRGASAHLS